MEEYETLARERIPERAPGHDPDDFSLAYNLLHVAYLLITDLEAEIHRPHGRTLPGFRLLFKLWMIGPAQPSRLARLSGLARSAVTNAVNTLERDGLVERLPAPDDGRAVQVALTAKGETAVREAFDQQAAREHEWFAVLDRAEREQLTSVLRRIVAARPTPTKP